MNIFKTLSTALLVAMLSTMSAYAFETKETSIESNALKITLDEKTGTGIIVGKVCDACETVTVNITPATLAYQGLTQVPLANAKSRLGKEATVAFDKETMEVIRIRW